MQQGAAACRRCETDGLHGGGEFDLAHGYGGRGRGRVRVRARGGGGSRGGLRVQRDDTHDVAEKHTRAAQELFATRGSALHACLCHVHDHARLGVPDAVRNRVVEAGATVRGGEGGTGRRIYVRTVSGRWWRSQVGPVQRIRGTRSLVHRLASSQSMFPELFLNHSCHLKRQTFKSSKAHKLWLKPQTIVWLGSAHPIWTNHY